MSDGFTMMTTDEYRKFIDWITAHGQELYENKIAYETTWTDDKYYVRLCDESLYTLDNIMLDIDEDIVYNVQHDDE
jgi:hypothetical protein